ncbi:MAG: phosphoribosylamine--glycine ligase [Oscillospiraceae bacterium]
MKILVVGGGGREHAIIKKLKESSRKMQLYAAPGNGGIAYDAKIVDIKSTDIESLADFSQSEGIDYVIVAPDDPLVLGLVDRLAERGIPAFGPDAAAARIEGSKAFAKNLMKKYEIPTAGYEIFTDVDDAMEYIRKSNRYPVVIKADGLALGKGVLICADEREAGDAVREMLVDGRFGASGSRIVIEEFLMGPEVSVLCFTDGQTLAPMASSMDHKRAFDGDLGLNTGGMGTIAPNPYYTDEIADACMRDIFLPTVDAMRSEGCPFKGCLYFGLMLTENGPRVIEYNCRFGDPEAQVVLPLLEGDLLEIMLATTNGTLKDIEVRSSDKSAACVVLASGGYPEKYEKGKRITGLQSGQTGIDSVFVYHAGTAQKDGEIVTSGGRVLGVCAVGDNLPDAIRRAYDAADTIDFENVYKRSDIGGRALAALSGK